ncbi:MAG: ArgE/DapE family deacylase [Hyphomicrobiales bacterium]|nr:ArgE/DapE family deacylase [Hyphomicrobiales bacterium]
MESSIETLIRREVDRRFPEQVDFVKELVRFPSTRGNEAAAQEFMASEYRDRGLTVDHWQIDIEDIRDQPGFSPVHVSYDNAFNVVGTSLPESNRGRSLILNGHIDVVPTGPVDMWTRPPFDPVVDGAWMYGRGAGDMKAGLSVPVFALDALRGAGVRPAAPVHVQSVIEEECTGNGALACLRRGYRADAALIAEPQGGKVIGAQVGVIWFQVTIYGKPVHARETGRGVNAIEAAIPMIRALHDLEARWNAPDRRHPAFARHDHPINLNIGRIEGGDWASSVPAWCTVDVRIGIFPDRSIKEACQEVEACIQGALRGNGSSDAPPPKISFHGFLAEGYVLTNAESPLAVLGRAHRTVEGTDLEQRLSTATTDARFFGLYAGIPALVYGPRAEEIHGFDERVDLESLRRCTQVAALFIADWCALEPV